MVRVSSTHDLYMVRVSSTRDLVMVRVSSTRDLIWFEFLLPVMLYGSSFVNP